MNPGYLHAMAKRVERQEPTHAVEDVVVFKDAGARSAVVVLPGSFLNVRYLSDFAAGLTLLGSDVLGVNYPGHSEASTIEAIDSLHLVDYAAAVYSFLLSVRDAYDAVYLVGHSLGTILVQLSLFLHYTFAASGEAGHSIHLGGIAILGGGPPKVGFVDYVTTLLARPRTLSTVMQMVRDPGRFISEKGGMKRALGDEVVYDDLVRRRLLFAESRSVMREAFLQQDHHFVPAKIVKDMGIRTLFAYAVDDFFVSGCSSRRAARQWAATPHVVQVGHAAMVMGAEGRRLGAACAKFFKASQR